MKKKVRPLSPHLLIYEPQLTSIFSIFHRIHAGLLVFFFVFLLILFYIDNFFSSFFLSHFLFFCCMPFFKIPLYFMFYFYSFVFLFHMINGLRHISWDFGLGLEIKNVYITGTFVFLSSLLIIFLIIII